MLEHQIPKIYLLDVMYDNRILAKKTESKFNDIENIDEMFRTHTSYLNYFWNPKITQDKWESSIYNGENSVYQGQTAKKYIEDHMGYRLVLRYSKIKSEKKEMQTQFSIENTGFANIVNDYECNVIVQCQNKQYVVNTGIDVTKWNSDRITTENISLEIPDKSEATIYLKISDGQYNIQFANDNIYNKKLEANCIGNVK